MSISTPPTQRLRSADSTLELRGKTAIVTGAASGIGLAISRRLGKEGMAVLMADVDSSRLSRASRDLRRTGIEARPFRLDVSDFTSVEEFAALVFELCTSVDVLCLNAGIAGPIGETTWTISEADWAGVLAVNLWGAINGIRAFVPRLLSQASESHLIITSSMASLIPIPIMAPYAASKTAVYALANTLRLQLADSNVRLSVLCPGSVRTPLLDSLRSRQAAAEAHGLAADERVNRHRPPLTAGQVADTVLATIGTDRFHIFTHPSYLSYYVAHFASTLSEWP
jgi:1-deoxy-11beta-hydroxypentalenate dehydrogenase